MTKLSAAALGALPAGVAAPKYARADLKPGIVHIGVGNFHRAHQAVYLDELFNKGLSRDFALIGAGVRADRRRDARGPARAGLVDDSRRAGGARQRRACHRRDDRLHRAGDSAALLAEMVKPEIRIVSLTITEGGYYISPATQRFDPAHPDIAADARISTRPRPPSA